MIFARRELHVRMFFKSAHAKTPLAHWEIKSPLILSIATRSSSRGRRDYCPVSVDQWYDSDCSEAILTGDW